MRILKFFAIVACAFLGACSGRIYTGPNSYVDLGDQATPFGNGIYAISPFPQGACRAERTVGEKFACQDGRNEQRYAIHQGRQETELARAYEIYRLARRSVEHDPRTGFYVTTMRCYALATPMWINACRQGVAHGECEAAQRRLRLAEDRERSAFERGRASIGPAPGSTYSPQFYSQSTNSCPSGPEFGS